MPGSNYEQLPPREQAQAIERARNLAAAHANPTAVALLLMDIGDDSAAEVALTSDPAAIQGDDYVTLAPWPRLWNARG